MDALIFDFDGVVMDSEPVHLLGFTQVLETVGIELTRRRYLERYLGFDDYECFTTAMGDHGKSCDREQLEQMVARKTQILKQQLGGAIPPIPGVVELIRAAEAGAVPLGVCSGALRDEIEIGLRGLGLRDAFPVIVAAEDVHHSKPDPQGYRQAVEMLGKIAGRTFDPARCAACEDSPMGISAACDAGLNVLAVTTSYPAAQLAAAGRVVKDFTNITLDSLKELCES